MQPFSGNQRPALMNMSLVLRLPRKMHLSRFSSDFPRLPSFFEMLQNVLLIFDNVHNPLHLPRKTTSERPKVLRPLSFLHFWLRNVLRATTACTFSTSQLPKVVRTWCALYILTSKCASRHSTLRGRRGTISYPPSFQVQAWRNVTSTSVLRGRRGIYGTGWHAGARFGCAWRRGTLRGRRGTWWHLRSFHVAGVALHHIYFRFAWQAWRLSDIHLGFTDHLTHIFVTHHLSHTIFVTHHLSQCVVTQHLSYNLCQQFSHAHLCNTPSSRLPPQTHHHLSHTLRHIPSFTHNFVAHRLSHTIFHKSLWLKQKRLEQKTFWTSNSCFVCRHVYLAASPACLPRCIPLCHTQLF